jgi:hypothetical protein
MERTTVRTGFRKIASMDTELWRPDEQAFASQRRAQADSETTLSLRKAVLRLVGFCAIIILAACVVNRMVTTGLRNIKTSAFGALNQVMEGKVNADVVITGSSRALAHYDPRVIEAITGRTAFNLGRNGSQTDMQVAFLKAYLDHNRQPQIVIHNLDAFSFVTTREVFNQVEYTPYLYDRELYDALWKIDPNIWKSRDVPLYGYVVEDMNFSWVLGLKGLFGWSPREDYALGFNPRRKQWSEDFDRFKADRPSGISFEIEPAGVRSIEDLIDLCQRRGIQLIFVYSPEYGGMQAMTANRREIFHQFHELSDRHDVPLWDYSNWKYANDREYFQNSQHLNADGAAVFSEDLANRLKLYLVAQGKAADVAGTRVGGVSSAARQY